MGHGDQLWKSDGTAAGTTMVTDGNDGVVNAGLFPYELTAVGGTLYFVAPDPSDGDAALREQRHGGGHDDGEGHPGGQRLSRVLSHRPDGGGRPALLLGHRRQPRQPALDDRRDGGRDDELTSGNASDGGTVPQSLTAAAAHVYFTGFDPTDKSQLWSSNGTAAGTERLTTANASGSGMNPQFLTAVGSTVYFAANDGVHGTQLWSSNGTTTTMLSSGNVSGGGLAPNDLTAVGSTLYFTGDDGVHGTQLWSSNGTAGGTAMVADINGTTTADVTNITDVNGTAVLRRVHDREWVPGLADRRDGGRDGDGHQPGDGHDTPRRT